MAFGWSVGDIIAAIKFIVDVAQALDEVNGAPKEFHQASSFLRNLDKALIPLRTFTSLEAKPEYKADIEAEVEAIRTPIEAFIKDVEGMAKRLGDGRTSKSGRFRQLRNIPSKLEWHYFTSKNALDLQKEVQGHMRIIDTLMQRLTVDMIHTLPVDMKVAMEETFNTAFNTHLSPLKSSIVQEMSQYDNINRSVWLQQLEELFERYLGSQGLHTTPLSSPSSPTQYTPTERKSLDARSEITIYTPEMLKANASHMEWLLMPIDADPLPRKIDGITADVEITHRIHLWWTKPSSDLLWIQSGNTNTYADATPIAADIITLAREANVVVLSYTCRRLNQSGTEIPPLDLLTDLVYSLIWQCAQHIREKVTTALDFSAFRFESLKNSPAATTEALLLLRDLLHAEDNIMSKMIVLNNSQLLDYSGDAFLETQVGELLDILWRRDEKEKGPRIKTLLTTEEQTQMLLDLIGSEQIVQPSIVGSSSSYLSISVFEDKGS